MHRKVALRVALTIGLLGVAFPSQSSFAYELTHAIGVAAALTKEPVDTTHSSLAMVGQLRLARPFHQDSPILWGIDVDWLMLERRQTNYLPARQEASGFGLAIGYETIKHQLWVKWGHGQGKMKGQSSSRRFGYQKADIGVQYQFYQSGRARLSLQGNYGYYWGDQRWQALTEARWIALPSLAIAISFRQGSGLTRSL